MSGQRRRRAAETLGDGALQIAALPDSLFEHALGADPRLAVLAERRLGLPQPSVGGGEPRLGLGDRVGGPAAFRLGRLEALEKVLAQGGDLGRPAAQTVAFGFPPRRGVRQAGRGVPRRRRRGSARTRGRRQP